MSRTFEIVVQTGKRRERLDLFLTHHVENTTRSRVQKAIEDGLVLVNGKPAKASHKVSPGEVVQYTIPKLPAPELVAEDIPLDIVYEDRFLLIVNKPAGMVTHPAYGNYTGTLVNALLYHCGNQLSRSHAEETTAEYVRPGIVHRLDKDTSGLMVIAKDDATHAFLASQFAERTIDREYWAIVWGIFEKRRGIIEASLGRSKSDRKKVAVTREGKHAITEYEVLEEFDFLSLLRLRLKTGRTHQIRVHLHHVGHPVFGDPTYGGRRIVYHPPHMSNARVKEHVQQLLKLIHRQALHAKTISFLHPQEKKVMRFGSELPEDMREVLARLPRRP